MKILFITPWLPYPLRSGGKIRDFNLLKALSSAHEVTFLSFALDDDPDKEDAIKAIGALVSRLETVSEPARYSKKNLFKGLYGSTPFSVLNYRSSKMESAVAALMKEGFDAVHCSTLQMAQYVLPYEGLTRVIDLPNVESSIMKRFSETVKDPFKKIYASLTAKKLKAYEVENLKSFNACLTVSDEDGYTLRADGIESFTVDNGVDTSYFAYEEEGRKEGSLLYTGLMSYHANDDAVKYYVAEILPFIKKNYAKASFIVAGKGPSGDLKLLGEREGVTVTGEVPDMRPYLHEASVYVVPLRVGGGTRLKILEAMAFGIPVVSTSIGCEGLKVSNGEDILIADSPQEFADAVVRLLKDPELCNKLRVRARALVDAHYGWDVIGAKLLTLYETISKELK